MAKKGKPASKGAVSDPKGTIYNDVNKIRALFNKILTLFEDSESNSKKDWINVVYNYFLDNIKFFEGENREIEKQSDDSYSYAFVRPINKVFDIHSSKFCKAFCQVINGRGNEINNINTLHSSALLGLLCFYSINKKNPLIIDMPFNNEKVKFEFKRVEFEKTNPVFKNPIVQSCIDIALYGTANGKPAVLYLESKFSEYIDPDDSKSPDKNHRYDIFYNYLEREGHLSNCGILYEYTKKKGSDNCKLHIKNINTDKHYCEGLKQMVSHTIGAVNSEENRREIYLAPILFDFGNIFKKADDNKHFSDYCEVYEKFAAGLKQLRDKLTTSNCYKDFFPDSKNTEAPLVKNQNKLFISDKVLSYQEFFKNTNFELPQAVKEYYNLQQD